MKRRVRFFIIAVIVLQTLGTTSSARREDCRKGKFLYSAATYEHEMFMKEKYRMLFDSLLQETVFNCFCETNIKNLPGQDDERQQPLYSRAIEPFFIDIESRDGLYGY